MAHKRNIALAFFMMMFLCCSAFAEEAETLPQPQKPYSLDDLYAMALKNAEQIKIYEKEVELAELDKKRALSTLSPDCSAFGQSIRYNDPTIMQPDVTSWGAKVNYSFTLNGRELTAYAIAKDNITKTKDDLDAVKEEYLFQVASAYYGVSRAENQVKLGASYIERLEKHKQAVLSKLKLEEAVKTSLYRAEAELSKSKTGLVQAENQLRLARAFLADLVGLPKGYEIVPPVFTVPPSFSDNVDVLKQEALTGRSELKAKAMETKMAERQIEWQKGKYWPSLSLEGVYSNNTTDPEFIIPGLVEAEDSFFSLSANLSFLLFDGGMRRADIRKASVQAEQASLAAEALSKKISLEVEEAYLDVTGYISMMDSLNDQVKFANEQYIAVNKAFQYGVADSIDVMDANTLLIESERQLTDIQFQYELARLKLKRAAGSFLRTELKE